MGSVSTVAIVDDHTTFSERLVAFVHGLHGCTVVGTAEDAMAGLRLVAATHPDLTLVDVGLPGEDGFWLCRRIVELGLGVDVVLMSQQGDGTEYARAAAGAGAVGFLSKTRLSRELPRLLRAVAGPTPSDGTSGTSRSAQSNAAGHSSPIAMQLGWRTDPIGTAPFHGIAVAGALAAAMVAHGAALGRPALGLAGAAGALVLTLWRFARPRSILRPSGGSGAAAGVLRPLGIIPSLPSGRVGVLRQSGGTPEESSVMKWLTNLVDRVIREEDGQDMVEYALILGLVSIIAVGAVELTGVAVEDIWNAVEAAVTDAATTVGG
jgi:DNA-binding NarL/FixJ family response regulator/Flp pilus assembly pilin Flp